MARECQHWIIAIDCFRHWRKPEESQSSFCGDTICSSGSGIGSVLWENCGCNSRNFSDWFWKACQCKYSKLQGCVMPWYWYCWKNHKHLSRCITIKSFVAPLLIASTRLKLLHWNSVCVHANEGPQIAQLNGTVLCGLAHYSIKWYPLLEKN